ncbi:MAG: hypothetical protein HGA85_09040 [Nanoarchaeota archaeon]|nr:hypothetical protein [Nanoarchaeota archaeon]
MTNIHDQVTNFISHDVSIRRGLSRGFINTRALASYIHRCLGLSGSLDAVISSIRRYKTDDTKEEVKSLYSRIAAAKVSSRSRMASFLFKKDMDVRKGLIKLYDKIDFSRSDILRILEVNQFIKIVVDDENRQMVEKFFSDKDIIARDTKLGEISLIYTEDVIETPGVFAALASELALNNISIRDGMICGSEHIFILKERDLMKALECLHSIARWGEKAT